MRVRIWHNIKILLNYKNVVKKCIIIDKPSLNPLRSHTVTSIHKNNFILLQNEYKNKDCSVYFLKIELSERK